MRQTLLKMRVVMVAIAVLCLAPALAAEAPVPWEAIEETAKRTGYTAEEIRKYFPPIQQWPVEPEPGKIAESFARERFRAPPKAYVHPRIYFNREDVPEIRRRLKETQVGRLMMAGIRGRLLQASPRREDWENVPYAPKPEDYERYAKQGLHIDRRMGYRGPWVGGWINTLAEGKVPEDLEKVWNNPPAGNPRRYLMHLLPYEAFRCLLDADEKGGKRVGAALATLAKRFQQDMDRWTGTDNWQAIYQPLNSHSLGLTYDWAYPWMTDEQRNVVRKTIAGITRGKRYLGLDQLPAFPGNTSNWNIIHANLLPMVLAIEGEEGYDEDVYLRIVEGLRKWVFVAAGPDGAPFEGLTKSAYAPHWLIPLAKRGHIFLGSEWSRNYIRKFHLHTMLPWGGLHVFETGIGASRDIATFKYAHPGDPVVDIIYASAVQGYFKEGARGGWPNIRTTYAPQWSVLFQAEDPLGAAGARYDFDRAYDRALAFLRKNEPLTYFSDYRGLMTTRSAWGRDAAFLYFEPRHVHGGHTRASRTEFVFAALGRVWAHRTRAVRSDSAMHSVILIDGVGQGPFRCVPARTIALKDTAAATFCAADATWPYSFVTCNPRHPQAQPVPASPNDSRLAKSPLPWMDQPWSFLPLWNSGKKPIVDGKPTYSSTEHHHWQPYNPVQHAYRTVGLVRGKHPYAMIVDDIRKDDQPHLYMWQMQVPDDLTLARRSSGKADKGQVVDLILADDQGRRLLVRVLAAGAEPSEALLTQAESKLETYEKKERRRTSKHKRIVLPLRAVTGAYKVLLYPFREGQELPKTAWNAGRTRLTVEWPGRRDELRFDAGSDGRTRVALMRDSKRVLAVE